MIEITIDNITYTYPESESPVFSGLSLVLPAGLVSLVGINGVGKSTLMLLASGRILPDSGKVFVHGKDTAELTDETEKQRYVSFIYQNMEFETEETIGELLEYVYSKGFHEKKTPDFTKELVEVFELGSCVSKKMHEVSKGELQRTVLAFSFLYGSKLIMMDEPVFSLEAYQKEKAFAFISDYVKKTGVSVYYSAHELDLSEKYSDHTLLFYKHGNIKIGLTSDVLVKQNIEEAYDTPLSMLKQKESLFREYLKG
jgi:iron complex transport system ATP-binding protein